MKRYDKQERCKRNKTTTRQKSRNYVKMKLLEKKPCEVCGSEKSEIHHPDYSKPNKIQWLCKKHHFEEHKKIRKERNMIIKIECPFCKSTNVYANIKSYRCRHCGNEWPRKPAMSSLK